MAQRYLPGKIIRHKHTGQPLFVIHVYRVCTIVADLSEGSLPTPRVLFERDYPNWVSEEEVESRENTANILDPFPVFRYHKVSL